MADTALGELRRPARPIEQRIERLARWRAQGLDAGESDAPFPADAMDSAAFAGSGDSAAGPAEGGAGTPQWLFDAFDLESGTANSFALSATPIENSEVVRVNGLVLEPTEYTITGSTLELTDIAAVRLGVGSDTWRLVLNYAYYDLATGSGDVITSAYITETGTTLPETVVAGDVALCFLRDDGGTPTGTFSTWTLLHAGAGGGVDIWAGEGVGTGTSVGVTGGSGFGNDGVVAVFRGVSDPVSVAVLQVQMHQPPTASPIDATAAASASVGRMVTSVAIMTPGGGGDWALPGTYTSAGIGAPLSQVGGNSFYDLVVVAGLANGASVDTSFDVTGSAGDGGAVYNIVFGPAPGDPAIATPDGTYTPPTPPATPGTHVLRYQRPDTTGYTALDVVAGGTFNLDNSLDYAITASGPITSDYVRLVGGRNLDIYGLVFDFDGSVPTGSYDSARRGLHIKDGPNPFLKRVIYCEGIYLRSGYYSDGIQIALRSENDVTFICQALRSDAYGWGKRSGVHSDLIQCYGGPLNMFLDCITGKLQTYQGIFARPADSRPLPSGADKEDWQWSRINLESTTGPDGTGAHYLLWDGSPSWTNLTLDEVYIDGGGNDVTDGNGNIPSSGLFQNATPGGGDWAPSSWWVGDTYVSPGYV